MEFPYIQERPPIPALQEGLLVLARIIINDFLIQQTQSEKTKLRNDTANCDGDTTPLLNQRKSNEKEN